MKSRYRDDPGDRRLDMPGQKVAIFDEVARDFDAEDADDRISSVYDVHRGSDRRRNGVPFRNPGSVNDRD